MMSGSCVCVCAEFSVGVVLSHWCCDRLLGDRRQAQTALLSGGRLCVRNALRPGVSGHGRLPRADRVCTDALTCVGDRRRTRGGYWYCGWTFGGDDSTQIDSEAVITIHLEKVISALHITSVSETGGDLRPYLRPLLANEFAKPAFVVRGPLVL
jgi:hypothetical protein